MSVNNGQEFQLLVPAAFTGQRLDKFLSEALPKTSRTQAQRLVGQGFVTIAGTVCEDSSRKLQPSENIRVYIPSAKTSELIPAKIPLDILFEDNHLLVVNKPAGLTVHPAPGEKGPTLVHALLHHCGKSLSGIGGVQRPGIVHRLDKDTSGAIIVAKNDAAHQALTAQLQDRSLSRVYHAICYGIPNPPKGSIEGDIGRSPHNRKKMAVVTKNGKTARTHYQILEIYLQSLALIECRLETGRTHQIRVHLAHKGHPLVGDDTYGRPRKLQHEALRQISHAFPRQALHAAEMSFIHPQSKEKITISAPYAEDFRDLLEKIRESDK